MHSFRFAERFGMPVYVDFGNVSYSYSASAEAHGNSIFWDRCFEQSVRADKTSVINLKMENYPLRIWNRGFFRELHAQFRKHLRFTPLLSNRLKRIKRDFPQQNCLGVHIRRTDHGNEVFPANLERYMRMVEKMQTFPDSIFLATDDSQVVNLFRERYGDRLISNPVTRSEGNKAVHDRYAEWPELDLALDALVDCYSLSLCSTVILSPSNFSYASLIMNPELEYVLVESAQAKRTRTKTSILYHLDKWGIRRW